MKGKLLFRLILLLSNDITFFCQRPCSFHWSGGIIYLADLLLIVLIQKCNIRCIQLKQKWKLLSRLIFSFSRRFESVWNEICFPDWSSLLSSDIIFSGAHLVFSLHSSFLGRKISCLPISFYLLGTRTIYFTTFSNVSYKLPPDPWQAIGKVIRMQIFFSKYFFFDQR